MDSLPTVDALVKEYLLFRGFTTTFQAFCTEAQDAAWMSLVPEVLVRVIFDELIARQDLERLWRLMAYISDQIYSRISTDHDDAARRVELVIFQAFLVEAVKQNKRSNVRHFFEEHADDLLASPDAAAWQQWLALPYMRHPWEHHQFKSFFSPQWQHLARQLVHTFFATVLPETPLPTILQLQADRQAAQRSAADVAALQSEIAQLNERLQAQQHQHTHEDSSNASAHSATASLGDEGVELQEMCERGLAQGSYGAGPRSSDWPVARGEPSAEGQSQPPLSQSVPPGVGAGGTEEPQSERAHQHAAASDCSASARPPDRYAAEQTAARAPDAEPGAGPLGNNNISTGTVESRATSLAPSLPRGGGGDGVNDYAVPGEAQRLHGHERLQRDTSNICKDINNPHESNIGRGDTAVSAQSGSALHAKGYRSAQQRR